MCQYDNDLASAQKIEPDVNKLRVIDGNKDYEDEINGVESLSLPKITYPDIDGAKIDRLEKILARTYSDNVPSSEIVSWLEKGISLHGADADTCLFCQNIGSFSIDTIQERVNRYIADEKQKDSKFLEEPTFGGINLEDIKAPECFYVERELRKRCKIPVFSVDRKSVV